MVHPYMRSMAPLLTLLALLATAEAVRLGFPQQQQQQLQAQKELNDRPIIGVLSQPGPPAPDGSSYIAASYVKWVEAAGARVVPLFFDMTRQELEDRFRVINGLLLPGGGAVLRPGHAFYDTASALVDLALKANDAGDYFPVWGTCLGMEVLSIIISANTSILADTDAEDAAAPLLYTAEARGSSLLTSVPQRVVQNLQDQALAMENHGHGLLMSAYQENPALSSFFKVLSLSIDKSGVAYISTMEASKYPVTAVQWHPEKNAYEWPTWLHIPHGPAAVEVGQEMANYFVGQARRSRHRPANEQEEDDFLVYNWPPQFTGRRASSGGMEEDFMQTYVFGPAVQEAARLKQRRQQRQQVRVQQ